MRWRSRVTPVLLAFTLAGCEKPAVEAPRARPKVVKPVTLHDAGSIRRVCLQMGLGLPGTGGGSIVFATGPQGSGIGIDTLHGEHAFAPGPSALCTVPEQPLRVCPADAEHTGEVLVTDDLAGTKPAGTLVRGAPLAFYEYVAGDGPTKAVVSVDGKARFVPGDEVCHLEPPPATSRATEKFKMDGSVKGGPKSFRPRSTSTIKRIVIHNTEIPLLQTLHVFGRPEANTSAHVVIDRDGTMYRVIEDHFVAFHAGASKDHLGGHNSTSLGIEVVAYIDPMYGGESGKFAFFGDAQREAVIKLVDFWMAEYGLSIAPEVLANRSSTPGYADLEYGRAALTVHRLTKADRGTDCPRLLFPNSPDGDEAFFRWREATFAPAVQRQRMQ